MLGKESSCPAGWSRIYTIVGFFYIDDEMRHGGGDVGALLASGMQVIKRQRTEAPPEIDVLRTTVRGAIKDFIGV